MIAPYVILVKTSRKKDRFAESWKITRLD